MLQGILLTKEIQWDLAACWRVPNSVSISNKTLQAFHCNWTFLYFSWASLWLQMLFVAGLQLLQPRLLELISPLRSLGSFTLAVLKTSCLFIEL